MSEIDNKKDEDKVDNTETPKKEEVADTPKVEGEETPKADGVEVPVVEEKLEPNELDTLRAENLALKTANLMTELTWMSDDRKAAFAKTFESYDIEQKTTISTFLHDLINETKVEEQKSVVEEQAAKADEVAEPSMDEVSNLYNS